MINSTVFILLGVGLSGYIYLSRVYDYKYKVPHYQGHHLLFRSLTTGAIFYIVTSIGFVATWHLTSKSSFLHDIFSIIYPDISQKLFNQIVILFSSIILAFIASRLRNGWQIKLARKAIYADEIFDGLSPGEYKETLQIAKKQAKHTVKMDAFLEANESDYLDHILGLSEETTYLLVTLKSQKCYICLPLDYSVPREVAAKKEVSVIPIASGYRDKDTQSFRITSYYQRFHSYMSLSGDEIDEMDDKEYSAMYDDILQHRVTFSLDNVMTISYFDFEQYAPQLMREEAIIKETNKMRGVDSNSQNPTQTNGFDDYFES